MTIEHLETVCKIQEGIIKRLTDENTRLLEVLNTIAQDHKIVPRGWQDEYSGTGEKQPTKAALIAKAALEQKS